ncbi:chorismate pyruvate-lyase family protein [Streptomyces sp. NPDC019224]|uniref:chorismate--pyruvate lyase family protein n=1 Tax=Streptomyces sp. NPDC019224 TaxID=3154484 RepID=UPI003403109B
MTGSTAHLSGTAPQVRHALQSDGTFTSVLETLVGEPVGITRVSQHDADRTHYAEELETDAVSRLLVRRVVLAGLNSGIPLAVATTHVVPDRLPARFVDDLRAGRHPIGRLLLLHRIESLREPVRLTGEAAAQHAPLLGHEDPHEQLLVRSYRVVIGAVPAMLIRERVSPTGLRRAGAALTVGEPGGGR